jgi:hypothetical protein
MVDAFVLVAALIAGAGLGLMLGRWYGFLDAKKDFDAKAEKLKKDTCKPPRDARGRFVKRS